MLQFLEFVQSSKPCNISPRLLKSQWTRQLSSGTEINDEVSQPRRLWALWICILFASYVLYGEPQTRKVEGCVPAVPFMRFRYLVVCKGALVE